MGFSNKVRLNFLLDKSSKHKHYLQAVVIDAKGHLLGRLASIVAKSILQGN